jgi:hypothetical protein
MPKLNLNTAGAQYEPSQSLTVEQFRGQTGLAGHLPTPPSAGILKHQIIARGSFLLRLTEAVSNSLTIISHG